MRPATPKGKKRAAATGELEKPVHSAKRARTPTNAQPGEVVIEREVANVETASKITPKKQTKKPKTNLPAAGLENGEPPSQSAQSPPKAKGKRKAKDPPPTTNGVEPAGEAAQPKPKRKRKTKEEKEAEMLPLAPRTIGSKLLVGAHVSAAGGVQSSVLNSVQIGGNAFALFLKSQRKWSNPPLNDDQCSAFKASCSAHGYDVGVGKKGVPAIVPHGSYLVNLAHPDTDRAKQAFEAFSDDLSRCARLGIRLYNFHPGNCAASKTRAEGIGAIARQLNDAHKDPGSGDVITLLETMASGGNTIGSRFDELRDVIEDVERKERVGVCLDTCHVFAAGYDIRSSEGLGETLDEFERVIGLKYLMALHVNDSKAPLGSKRDLHANIGTGFLGLRAFHALVNEERLWGLPMVLETPIDVKDPKTGKDVEDRSIWAREIKLLESLVGMDPKSEEFVRMEKELEEKGRGERERVNKQVEKKNEKTAKAEGKKDGHIVKRIQDTMEASFTKKKGKSKGKEEEADVVTESSTQGAIHSSDYESGVSSDADLDEVLPEKVSNNPRVQAFIQNFEDAFLENGHEDAKGKAKGKATGKERKNGKTQSKEAVAMNATQAAIVVGDQSSALSSLDEEVVLPHVGKGKGKGNAKTQVPAKGKGKEKGKGKAKEDKKKQARKASAGAAKKVVVSINNNNSEFSSLGEDEEDE